jgi:hypothetical protein
MLTKIQEADEITNMIIEFPEKSLIWDWKKTSRWPATKAEGRGPSRLHFGRRQKWRETLQFRKKLIVTGLSGQNFEEFRKKLNCFGATNVKKAKPRRAEARAWRG